ncbi:MAG: 50S ribosomal protein L11 methyltransferase [Campylobacter sputorum]|uniref:50S ribosomal protein L11 methyltransferase n=1 Tax=Campylobacter sputorum TaxID=206 RepID=UPI000B793DDE|nr:50S ribosomal protein L11 methyltransferase [Campylobacter sputorum]ASM38877.1 50S ribosomal protein L11 methyltransferase [Campylobacter sputorum bv. paraureolyticus LMG 11764]MDY6121116.1 50S ribosomal protein L11 methyltransferase [Campylobacter sputorum]
MKDHFFELSIKSSLYFELFSDFIFSLGITCIEQKDDYLIIRSEENLDDVLWGIKEYAKRLEEIYNKKIVIESKLEKKENIDWIKKYQDSVQPIQIGDFYIRPSWEKPKNSLLDIIIDPALAFGSGHHESTATCIQLIQKYTKDTKTALDVGCGSGILSIIMSKLGLSVDSCDTDEQAIQSTLSNAKKNSVSLNNLWCGSISNLEKKYDFVVANIIADVIFVLKNDLKKAINKDGYLLLSGILNKYDDRIKDSFSDLTLLEHEKLNEWSSFIFKK